MPKEQMTDEDYDTIMQIGMMLNTAASLCHRLNDKWWRDPVTRERIQRNKGELLMLMVSEIAEAMEGERKSLMDTHLPHRKMVEVELADAFIRMCDYSGAFEYKIGDAFIEKMHYNWSRPDHSFEARAAADGKKF